MTDLTSLAVHVLAVVGLGALLVLPPVIAGMRVAARRSAVRRRAQMRSEVEAVSAAAWSAGSAEQILDDAAARCRRVLGAAEVDATLHRLTGGRFAAELSCRHRTGADGDQFLRDMERVVADAAERHTLGTRLRLAASTDVLTGLPNSQALEQHLTRVLARSTSARVPVAVLACDVVGLTTINDRYGRSAGDRLLSRIAEHLRACAGPDDLVARAGGDQFVVVVEDPRGEVELLELARRVRRGSTVPTESLLSARLSVGLTVWEPGDPLTPETLLRDVHLALAVARDAGSGVAVFDAEMRTRVAAETERRGALERAIDEGEIMTVFQPLVDARTLGVVGLEVLARWRTGDRLVSPVEWLDLAESSGLIVPLGVEVIRQARAASDRWGVAVAVNVSACQLDLPSFVDQVVEAWGEDRWEYLTVEVTESALLFDAAHVRRTLEDLAARGARIAIDDFGTGYNSLARLGQLPLNELKIDRSFVEDVLTERGAAVVRAVVGLAEAHGLEVVAEGVERPEQLSALVALGVRTVQGYMFGRPRRDVGDLLDGRGTPRRRRVTPADGGRQPQLRSVGPAATA